MKKKPEKSRRRAAARHGPHDLHAAVLANDLARAQRLMAGGADVNALDDDGFAPLHLAAQQNRPDMVRALLAHGAAVDVKDCYGNSPLMRALDSCYLAMGIGDPDPGAVIKTLLQAGADPESKNNYGISVTAAVKDCDRDLKQFFKQKRKKRGA